MEHEVGDERLLERRGEALDELRREPADEADGVGDEVAAAVVLEAARRRVERLEEPVADGDAGVGERVEERRLAGVRVAGERDRRRLAAAAFLPADVALAAEALEALPQERDAAAREAAVGLELRLAGAAGADAAAEALEVLPHPAHPRQVVFELRELDLELALGAHGVLGEDVEDERVRSTTRASSSFSSVRCCDGLSSLSTMSTSAFGFAVGLLQLLELPLADERARIGARAVLDDLRDRVDAGGARELLELGDLVCRVGAGREHGEDEPALGLGRRRAIGLFHRHPRVIMTLAVSSPDLAARTLELVDTPSESRHEA